MRQGHDWVRELLHNHPERIYEQLRMDKHILLKFCEELKANGLQPSKNITVEEQVAMFLMILAHSNSSLDNAEQFQHSTATVSKYFRIVLHAVNRFEKLVIVPPNLSDVPTQILKNSRFHPYLKFTYYLIAGKYYVVDFGYSNIPEFLAPYRGYTAHFQEMRRRCGPKGREELFNYRHSSLCNVIECCFGVLKKRFSILKNICSYSYRKQTLIVIACCAIHNYIRMHAVDDYLFSHFEGGDVEAGASEAVVRTEFSCNPTQVREMAEKCDTIANQMWSDYNIKN
ncbi:hypothetical protein LINGRAHAP2_LOCUS28704 [Linum grandiflorum]